MSKSQARVKERISALPDAVLWKILSYVDTQCAVRTTVLSPRWNNLWTSLPNLYFSDEDFSNNKAFMTFVDRVLFYRDSSDIKEFYLNYCQPQEDDFSHIESWISTAIRHNVVELSLCVDTDNLCRTFELPQSLFTCKTLEMLSLNSDFIASPPKSGCFPSLKVVNVLVHYPKLDNLVSGHIFSKCPVLEDLRLDGALGSVSDYNISAPQLKRLTVGLFIEEFDDDGQYCFYINAPKLEVFNLPEGDSSVFSVDINATSLLKGNINLSSCYLDVDGTSGLLEAISHVKRLSLSTRYLEGGIPAFDNLNHLELTFGDSSCWQYLIEFLKKSQNLEHLVIKHDCKFKSEDLEFTPPTFVPVCLLSRLKTITIESIEGRQDEMRAAQYLLKYGEHLNKMTILTISGGEEKVLYKELLMFEQGSNSCQVETYD